MPKRAKLGPSIDKTRAYIRRVLRDKQIQLKFTNFSSKNCIIHKLNRFHYLQKDLYVIDVQTVQYLSVVFKGQNNVELISLQLCNIGDQGLSAFSSADWERVKFLNLGGNGFKKQGIDALSKAKLSDIKELSLSDNSLEPRYVQNLHQGKWTQLQKLNLNFNNLKAEGLKYLIPNKWKSLKEISLLANNICNQGLAPIVTMHLPFLQRLLLSHNLLTTDCAKTIIKGQWRQLKALQLDGNQIGDDALTHLSRLNCFKLQKLHLFGCKTFVINNSQESSKVLATMIGLRQLRRGHFERLRIQILLSKLGQISKYSFLKNTEIKEALQNSHVNLIFIK